MLGWRPGFERTLNRQALFYPVELESRLTAKNIMDEIKSMYMDSQKNNPEAVFHIGAASPTEYIMQLPREIMSVSVGIVDNSYSICFSQDIPGELARLADKIFPVEYPVQEKKAA